MIEKFQKEGLYDNIKPHLKKILDIEKLHRRMALSICSPYEFFSIHTSYTYLIKCIECIDKSLPDVVQKYKTTIHKLNEFISDYNSVFIIDELEKYSLSNIITSVFQKGIHQNLDDLQRDIDDGLSMIELICDVLNKYIDPKKQGCIKRDNNEKYGYYLYLQIIEQKRFKNLLKI